MSISARVLLVVLVVAVLLPAAVSACPLCKDAKSDTDYPGGGASLPKGFYYSILLMVSAPFAVVGGLVLKIFLARKRALSAAPSISPAASAPPLAPPARLLPDSAETRP